MNSNIPYYNPREAGEEILEEMLVGRKALLEEIFDDLRIQKDSESHQHWLIRGQRGIGKTHLLGLIYHRVRRDELLSKVYLPVWLGEADAYEVYSAGILLQTIAERLADELEQHEPAGAASLRSRIEDVEFQGDDGSLFDEISEILTEEARRQDRIILVLMENLDAIIEGFAPKKRKIELRRYRSLLLHSQEFVFISSTPTRYLSGLSDPEEPLYGQLKERILKPLTEAQIGDLFENLDRICGHDQAEVGDDLDPDLRRHLIQRLTGGIPRSVVMAYHVTRSAEGLGAMISEFQELLNRQTPYFEARLARLAPRERRILTTMALAPINLTIQEVAQRTRLPERSMSTLMKRVQQEGYIAPVSGGGGKSGKGTIYQVTDGMFRLWYQYRKGHQRLEPLIRILALWHSEEALYGLATKIEEKITSEGTPLLRKKLLSTCLIQIQEARRFAGSPDGAYTRMEMHLQAWMDQQGDTLSSDFRQIMESALVTMKKLFSGLGTKAEASRVIVDFMTVLQPAGVVPYEIDQSRLAPLQRIHEHLDAQSDSSPEGLTKLENLVASSIDTSDLKLITPQLLASSLANLTKRLCEDGRTEEALTHIEKFLAMLDNLDEPDEVSRAATLVARAAVLLDLDRRKEALTDTRNAEGIFQRIGPALPLHKWAELATALARQLGMLGEGEQMVRLLHEVNLRTRDHLDHFLAPQYMAASMSLTIAYALTGDGNQAEFLLNEIGDRWTSAAILAMDNRPQKIEIVLASALPSLPLPPLLSWLRRIRDADPDPDVQTLCELWERMLDALAQVEKAERTRSGKPGAVLAAALDRFPPEERPAVEDKLRRLIEERRSVAAQTSCARLPIAPKIR